MVMKVEPIYRCLEKIKFQISNFKFQIKPKTQISKKTRVVLFSAKGKKYTQADAKRLSKFEDIVLICGRYEGVDERVAKHLADEEMSIGDFVLTGGEIPAMAVVDSVARLIPGVLGNVESPKNESFSRAAYLEHPQYTKPAEFRGWKAPEVLLSGDHKKIEEWRRRYSKKSR
jgi:tRNA (guanine37-N1)-methyltransferase